MGSVKSCNHSIIMINGFFNPSYSNIVLPHLAQSPAATEKETFCIKAHATPSPTVVGSHVCLGHTCVGEVGSSR